MVIDIFKDSIGKEPLEYWNRLGFFSNIYNKNVKNKLAKAYSDFAEWIVNNPEKQKYSVPSFKTDFKIIFLPMVRQIIEKRPETEIVNVEDIYNYIVWYYYHYLDYYVNKKVDIDIEAQFVFDCMQSIIEELKDKEIIKEK